MHFKEFINGEQTQSVIRSIKKLDSETTAILNDLEKLHQGKSIGGKSALRKYWEFITSKDPDHKNPFKKKKYKLTGNGVTR